LGRLERIVGSCSAARLIPEAAPYERLVHGSRESFLLLHGFTGIPRELSQIGDALAGAGYTVYCPRYPGHGTDRADFSTTRAEDWLRRAMDAYLELKARSEKVYVLGHSMGGLIATIAASAFESERLVLLAPAFQLFNKAMPLTPLMAPFAPVIKRGYPISEADRADPVRSALFPDYWADDLVAQAAQLRRLQKLAIKGLPALRARVLVLLGEVDDVVPPSVSELIRDKATNVASFASAAIAGGGHVFPFGEHSGETAAAILDWLGK
jgi:carboxylesterase